MRQLERNVLLNVIDRKWREHLYEMTTSRSGIGLRAMQQRDPLVEFSVRATCLHGHARRHERGIGRLPFRRPREVSPPRRPPRLPNPAELRIRRRGRAAAQQRSAVDGGARKSSAYYAPRVLPASRPLLTCSNLRMPAQVQRNGGEPTRRRPECRPVLRRERRGSRRRQGQRRQAAEIGQEALARRLQMGVSVSQFPEVTSAHRAPAHAHFAWSAARFANSPVVADPSASVLLVA